MLQYKFGASRSPPCLGAFLLRCSSLCVAACTVDTLLEGFDKREATWPVWL